MANSNTRKAQLLAAARERLSQEQQARNTGAASPDSGPEILYRGQVVRQSGGATPGSPSRERQGGGKDDVRAALQKIKDLYQDGLISRDEAEQKRKDVLDRL